MESITFPQAPAPVIGIQRRRALCAVTAVKVILDEIGAIFEGGADCVPGCDIDGTKMYMEISR